jgi:uncharacterized protein YigA (DUF484 family)
MSYYIPVTMPGEIPCGSPIEIPTVQLGELRQENDALRSELTALRAALAEAKRDGERAQQLRSDTTAELLVCRNAPNMLKKDIAPMAAQIICPKDNVMSRMVKTIDNALQATYSASRDASEPAARTP